MKNTNTPEHSSNHSMQHLKPSGGSHRKRAGLAFLGLVVLAVGLSGCASAPNEQPPSAYNPVTGYPAVGDYSWRH